MGWLHADGKPVIIGLLSHTKPYTVAYLDTELYFNFSLVSGTEFGRMADMPSCNLLETAHNKWLQQSGNRGNNLFAATCDDKIRAVI
jgi:hypothetical protein